MAQFGSAHAWGAWGRRFKSCHPDFLKRIQLKMGVKIFYIEDQANGNFNKGEILEKKPIGFPQDGGKLKPYSNLFYWAHAWTPNKKSTIGLHPHQGFEICSFILKGKINHFDTKLNKWISLSKGDIQIIRSGNGISHSEEIDYKSEILQIWFDPDISKSLKKEASYDDYKSSDFKRIISKNKKIKVIMGEKSPMKMDSQGILINEYEFKIGKHNLDIKKKSIHSVFILEGKIKQKSNFLTKGTFMKIENIDFLNLEVIEDSKVFEIISPLNPSYKTYSHNR